MTKALTKIPPKTNVRPIKPDPMLVKLAEKAGVDLHKSTRRQKGESLLAWRMRDWNVPPNVSQPIDDQVIVWRLPPLQQSAGGLLIPDDMKSPNVRGILLAMGPRAMDVLCSNGIEVGHIVVFARFAGWEPDDNTPEFARHSQILMLKAKDINSSDDLKAMIDRGEIMYVKGDDGRYRLAKVTRPRKLPSARKKKLLALAKGTNNPNEAATARKLAQKE